MRSEWEDWAAWKREDDRGGRRMAHCAYCGAAGWRRRVRWFCPAASSAARRSELGGRPPHPPPLPPGVAAQGTLRGCGARLSFEPQHAGSVHRVRGSNNMISQG